MLRETLRRVDLDRVARLTGRTVVAAEPRTEGGYSPGERCVVRFADGGSAFAKCAPLVEDEHLVYSTVPLPCLPRLVAFEPGLLVTEDLSSARWGTPVTEADADLLAAALDSLRDVVAPAGLGAFPFGPKWRELAAAEAALLGTGLVDEGWLRHLPVLVAAEDVPVAGDRLVHADLWLQNWCRAPRGAVLVDWAGASAANHLAMRVGAEAGVRAAGGPPGRVLRGEPGWAAFYAGVCAWFLTGDLPADLPRLTETLRREAWATLCWACDELDLPYPRPSEAFTSLGPWRP